MTTTPTLTNKTAGLAVFASEILLIILATTMLLSPGFTTLVAFTIAVVLYGGAAVTIAVFTLHARSGAPHVYDVWKPLGLQYISRLALPLLVGVAGAATTLSVVRVKDDDILTLIAGTASLAAWIVSGIGCTRLYAYLCSTIAPDGIRFPGTPTPEFTDYLYFSLTIGMSASLPDADITDTRIRLFAAAHGICAFFYRLLILAVAVGFMMR